MRSLIASFLALLTDSPVFCDRQTWTSERTAGNVYSLSLRWSSEVTGEGFFFRFFFPFKLYDMFNFT